jgi:c-di-AMP phosphodiesterase-like protein
MQEGDNSIVDNLPEIEQSAQDSKDAKINSEAMTYINCFSLSYN